MTENPYAHMSDAEIAEHIAKWSGAVDLVTGQLLTKLDALMRDIPEIEKPHSFRMAVADTFTASIITATAFAQDIDAGGMTEEQIIALHQSHVHDLVAGYMGLAAALIKHVKGKGH